MEDIKESQVICRDERCIVRAWPGRADKTKGNTGNNQMSCFYNFNLINMDTAKQIIGIISALIVPIIAVMTYLIMRNQYRLEKLQHHLEKLQWRLAVYEKRYAIYDIVKKYLANIMGSGTVTYQEAMGLLRNTKESEFLFKEDINKFLNELYKKGLDLELKTTLLEKQNNQTAREKLVDEKRILFDWFEDQFKNASNLFGPYLKIED